MNGKAIKPNKEKIKTILQLKPLTSSKELNHSSEQHLKKMLKMTHK